MKRVIVILCCLISAQAGSALAANWVNITPQANLEGWTRVAIPPAHPLNPVSQWKLDASRGLIICEGNRGHEWLRYNHRYKNFIFEAQWKLILVRGVKHYNSGVFVRNDEEGNAWYQAQVGSADGGYFFGDNLENGKLKGFNLRSMVTDNHMKPPGHWNTYRIRCDGQTLTLWVNGAMQSRFTHCTNPEGFIGLEAEGSPIQFRRLRIKELP